MRFGDALSGEPDRLLQLKQYRAAVISAFILFEDGVRSALSRRSEPLSGTLRSIRELLAAAGRLEILRPADISQVIEWNSIKNQLVHQNQTIAQGKAKKIVVGLRELLTRFR